MGIFTLSFGYLHYPLCQSNKEKNSFLISENESRVVRMHFPLPYIVFPSGQNTDTLNMFDESLCNSNFLKRAHTRPNILNA